MNALDIILLPFVFIYRGFISVILLPYYFVLGILKLFGYKGKKQKNTIPQVKSGEKVKVVKEVKSAYDVPVAPVKKVDPNKIEEEKNKSKLKRQKEFEKLVQKARQEEAKRIKEQERIRLENEKREKERQKKEAERRKKEEAYEALKDKKNAQLRQKGVPVTFSDKLKAFYKKLTFSKKEQLELEAKKAVLDEQFKDKENQQQRLSKALLFNYVARNPDGEIEKGSIEALSRVDVHSFLLAEGYEVYDITVAKRKRELVTYKMKRSKLIFYLSQLSAYLKSGIALADAVKILDDQANKTNEKKAWRAVYYDLSMGDVLSVAMEKRKDTFPKLLINMIKTAEMTGNLPETLDDMVDYYTEAESTKKQMKSAMMYPVIVTCFAAVVITFILMWVVPQFVDIYADLGSDIPTITKIVIAISDFLKNYLMYILLVIIVLILLFLYLFKNVKAFRRTVQEFAMHLPVFGNIIIYNEVTIFSKTFANLINHNVFITDSVDVLSKITDNEVYKKLIYDTAKNLTKGEPISKAFKDHWAFPNIAYQMLITGEKTGRLGPMMERVSNYYQEQHRTIINQMKTLIEPVMIVTLAVIVGGILLAVIIPMYGMYDAL
ncbi:MAG TPA: type II secretion system F family protein [Candidatus Aphodocola excrementigallinarum]|uniref:Type II secretion system F family protein n=1 Tax=Candidatus Aphodocola excrementigallinarum TaxID=2840670 RepID=A0A9D1IRK1_9FIRM|nr:type II secretion system F family protein [Candidatus Aphodocola excrementigallinarum]